MKKKRNKIASAVITFSVILCLAGCGNANRPVNGTAENIEEELPDSMDVDDIADMLDEGASVDEIIEKVQDEIEATESTEVKAEDTETTETKPTDEPTTTPAVPTSTPTPETPTPEPHVHEYKETVTRKPSCSTEGERVLTCSCGDSKTEAIPVTGEHNWEPIYQTVTHPSTGHVEEVQVQVGTTKRTEYECGVCGQRANTPSELADHRASFVGTDRNHATANTIAWDYEEPVYEMQSQWVVDTPETTTQELVGYKCSICGATK